MAGTRNDRYPRGIAGLLLIAAAASGRVQAQGWGGSLGYGTDNVYRGVSLSSGRPAWLADLHYGLGTDWIVGLGASQERPPFQDAGAQFTLYLDRRWQLDEDWSAKLGVVHYESPWNVWRDELNYNEVTAAIGWRGRWRASLALSPDTPGVFTFRGAPTGFAAAAELSYRQPLAGRLAADVGLGYARLDAAGFDYAYGNVGLSYGIGDVYLYTSLLWATPDAIQYNTGSQKRRRWVTSLVWNF